MSDGKRSRPKRYRVTFEPGHDLEDLELTMRRIPFGALVDLSAAADELRTLNAAAALTDTQAAQIRSLAAQLARVIIDWNRDDEDGNPVTPDAAGIMAQDPWTIMQIFEAYADHVLVVPPPLPVPSPPGGTPPDLTRDQVERELGLASSSSSLPSSTTPS